MKNKRLTSIVLCLILVAGTLTGMAMPNTATKVNAVSTDMAQTSANQYGLLDQVEGGLILHCWCWSFNTIKANLEKIAEAGYTAVQTSPISKCLVGDGGGMQLNGNGKWYYHYQPTAYTIGNYQLGTEAEFKSLCEAAHSYGIKVIVDVVANHTTPDRGAVDSELKNIPGGCYHNNGGGIDYKNRKQITQNDLISLPDLNTQNPNIQNHILNFLKQAVADGADGFRYDAAKHIELPDDDSSYASNFWPTVLDNGSSFQYGEILEDEHKTARSDAYSKLMHVTASSYGYKLREQIGARQITANAMSQYYMTGVTPDRMVTWVESHDNYCDNNTWKDYSNTQIRLCWAIAVAQGDTTSLFFNRPNGSSQTNMWGNNRIGAAGDNNYCDPEVTAVNRFHNAMYGQDKELKNLNSKAVLMISRGNSGVTIINSGTESVSVNTETTLPDGKYTDYAHGGTFTVSNGTLTGTVGKEQIAVIYKDDVTHDPSVSISYDGTNTGGEFYDVAEVTLKSNFATSAYYQINSGNKIAYNSGDVITLGENMSEGESITLTLSAVGEEGTTPAQKSYVFTKVSRPALVGTTCVYFDNSSTNWDEVYVYVYRDNGSVTNNSWPGEPMTDLGDGIWGYAIDESFSDAYVIFNNNNKGSQDPQGQGYTINKGEKKILANGNWSNYTTPTNPTKPTTAPTTQPTTAPTTVTTVPKYYGDANCDGIITIQDVTAIQKHLADFVSLSVDGQILGNVDGGTLSIKDATCIQKYLAGFSTGIGSTGNKHN
ncbi:MAG: alpha-amylase family glycosyl hydrolase [Oscillospiraceae bacterium]|nr:alpha-amylase family glycosyl hydrolase [Oscillospiraceae bacterium]